MTNEGFRRGDVFMAELRAEPGSVEHGRRPVVILQNNIGNLYAPTLIVAHADRRADYVPTAEAWLPGDAVPGASDGVPAGREHCPFGADYDDR